MAQPLIEKARAWIEPYWNAEHLERTLDWLLELEPNASEALQLAALTHDMERFFPGGPQFDPASMQPGEAEYTRVHSERSAQIVGDWLSGNKADAALVNDVRGLLVLHETGGNPAADLLQAADSLSFLEVNADLVVKWAETGRCSHQRARKQHEWMFERIRLENARELAAPLYAAATSGLESR
ncbi:MAG: DUF4202 family protein [Gaiellaceae bacterium]